jgi:hypothetical protein
MKKAIAIVWSVLLLLSVSGVELRMHFCGKQIASVSAAYSHVLKQNNAEEDCCRKNIADTTCCSDKQVKIKSKQELSVKQELSKTVFLAPEKNYFEEQCATDCIPSLVASFFSAKSNSPPLYLLYCQQVLYA